MNVEEEVLLQGSKAIPEHFEGRSRRLLRALCLGTGLLVIAFGVVALKPFWSAKSPAHPSPVLDLLQLEGGGGDGGGDNSDAESTSTVLERMSAGSFEDDSNSLAKATDDFAKSDASMKLSDRGIAAVTSMNSQGQYLNMAIKNCVTGQCDSMKIVEQVSYFASTALIAADVAPVPVTVMAMFVGLLTSLLSKDMSAKATPPLTTDQLRAAIKYEFLQESMKELKDALIGVADYLAANIKTMADILGDKNAKARADNFLTDDGGVIGQLLEVSRELQKGWPAIEDYHKNLISYPQLQAKGGCETGHSTHTFSSEDQGTISWNQDFIQNWKDVKEQLPVLEEAVLKFNRAVGELALIVSMLDTMKELTGKKPEKLNFIRDEWKELHKKQVWAQIFTNMTDKFCSKEAIPYFWADDISSEQDWHEAEVQYDKIPTKIPCISLWPTRQDDNGAKCVFSIYAAYWRDDAPETSDDVLAGWTFMKDTNFRQCDDQCSAWCPDSCSNDDCYCNAGSYYRKSNGCSSGTLGENHEFVGSCCSVCKDFCPGHCGGTDCRCDVGSFFEP